MNTAEKEAMADLKAKVAEFMDAAKALAMEKIDRLQASGADIVGDHIANADKCWLTPRDFMAAFGEEFKWSFGWVRKTDSPSRKRTIKNYEKMM